MQDIIGKKQEESLMLSNEQNSNYYIGIFDRILNENLSIDDKFTYANY